MIPPTHVTIRQVAEALRLSYECVNMHIYPSRAKGNNYKLWPSVKIDGRRLIPKSFVATLTPKSVHRKPGNAARGLSLWRGKKREEAAEKLKDLCLDGAIEALYIPDIDIPDIE